MQEKSPHLLFTDGSSLGNPGRGGWGAILVLEKSRVIELGGREEHTTNNRMELTALIEGLRRLEQEEGDLLIYIDSAYVMNGATKWAESWKRRGWKTATKGEVLNRDLWEPLLSLLEHRGKHSAIKWKLIPGHVGIDGNERADAIATGFAGNKEVELFQGDIGNYAVDVLHIAVDDNKSELRKRSRARMRGKAYSYLSLVDGVARRHETWAECEKRVKGKAGAKYKKALSPEEERSILRDWGVRLSE